MAGGTRQKSGLTAAWVKRAKPKDKPYKLSDRDSLYLIVEPSGYNRVSAVNVEQTTVGRSTKEPTDERDPSRHLDQPPS